MEQKNKEVQDEFEQIEQLLQQQDTQKKEDALRHAPLFFNIALLVMCVLFFLTQKWVAVVGGLLVAGLAFVLYYTAVVVLPKIKR